MSLCKMSYICPSNLERALSRGVSRHFSICRGSTRTIFLACSILNSRSKEDAQECSNRWNQRAQESARLNQFLLVCHPSFLEHQLSELVLVSREFTILSLGKRNIPY